MENCPDVPFEGLESSNYEEEGGQRSQHYGLTASFAVPWVCRQGEDLEGTALG